MRLDEGQFFYYLFFIFKFLNDWLIMWSVMMLSIFKCLLV